MKSILLVWVSIALAAPTTMAAPIDCDVLGSGAKAVLDGEQIVNPKGLPADSPLAEAVIRYQGGPFSASINNSLRRRAAFTDPLLINGAMNIYPVEAMRQDIRHIDRLIDMSRAIDANPAVEKYVVTYRRSGVFPTAAAPDLGFMSLSLSHTFVKSLPATGEMAVIIVRPGAPVLEINRVLKTGQSAFGVMEEVLAPRGSHVEAVDIGKLPAEVAAQIVDKSLPVYFLNVPTTSPAIGF